MSKQEQSRDSEEQEVKQEVYPANVENQDAKKIDNAFATKVFSYYEKRNGATMAEAYDLSFSKDDEKKFIEESRESLMKLSHPDFAESLPEKDVSLALSELAGVMADNGSDNLRGNDTEEIKQAIERSYADARKIFMDSCKKMYPSDEQQISVGNLKFEVLNLQKREIISDEPEISPSQTMKLFESNPKALAEQIDGILGRVGKKMSADALRAFDDDVVRNGVNVKESNQERLGSGIESVYKLQLMRDKLTEKMYGRKDITPTEIRQIEEARDRVK
jgi:hypothetical protein